MEPERFQNGNQNDMQLCETVNHLGNTGNKAHQTQKSQKLFFVNPHIWRYCKEEFVTALKLTESGDCLLA